MEGKAVWVGWQSVCAPVVELSGRGPKQFAGCRGKLTKTSISAGDQFHDLLWMPETADTGEPYIQHTRGWDKGRKRTPLYVAYRAVVNDS